MLHFQMNISAHTPPVVWRVLVIVQNLKLACEDTILYPPQNVIFTIAPQVIEPCDSLVKTTSDLLNSYKPSVWDLLEVISVVYIPHTLCCLCSVHVNMCAVYVSRGHPFCVATRTACEGLLGPSTLKRRDCKLSLLLVYKTDLQGCT